MTPQTQQLLYLCIPFTLGLIITLVNADPVNNFTEKIESWIRRWQINNCYSDNFVSKWVLRPILWVLVQFHNWTDSLKHRGLKNGIRIAVSLYFVAIALLLVTWIAIFVLMCVIAFYGSMLVISYMRQSENNSGSSFNFGKSLFSSGGSSKKRRDFLGNDYVEYYDRNGNVVGKSELEKSFIGGDEYMQYYDSRGNKVGTSEIRENFIGYDTHTQYYDENGNKIGESENRTDLVGRNYEQHYDEKGNKVGQSKKTSDFLGNKKTEFE